MVIANANQKYVGPRIWARLWCIEMRAKALTRRAEKTLATSRQQIHQIEQKLAAQA